MDDKIKRQPHTNAARHRMYRLDVIDVTDAELDANEGPVIGSISISQSASDATGLASTRVVAHWGADGDVAEGYSAQVPETVSALNRGELYWAIYTAMALKFGADASALPLLSCKTGETVGQQLAELFKLRPLDAEGAEQRAMGGVLYAAMVALTLGKLSVSKFKETCGYIFSDALEAVLVMRKRAEALPTSVQQ